MRVTSEDINVYREIIEQNIYFKSFGKYDFSLNDGDVVIDIGGHIGLFSLRACEIASDLKINIYEPDSKNVSKIKGNFAKNESFLKDNRVIIHEKAVSDKDGIDFLNIVENTSGHSLSKEKLRVYHEEVKETQKVEVVDISKIIGNKRINYLKIDCEGEEYKIFERLSDKQLRNVDKVVLEYHESENADIIKIFERFVKNNFYVVMFNKLKNLGLLYAYNKARLKK